MKMTKLTQEMRAQIESFCEYIRQNEPTGDMRGRESWDVNDMKELVIWRIASNLPPILDEIISYAANYLYDQLQDDIEQQDRG